MYDFQQLSNFLIFLGQTFGPDAEILLCDREKILYAQHPFTPQTAPGNPLGVMEHSFLEEGTYRTCDSMLNYRGLLPSGERLRGSTLFLKDDQGELVGFLTINLRVEKLIKAQEIITTLINGVSPSIMTQNSPLTGKSRRQAAPGISLSRYEGVNSAIQDITQSVIEGNLAAYGVSAERLTATERMKIVQELDHQGVFLVKGSIGDVAQRLCCSEATIYRYLQQLG